MNDRHAIGKGSFGSNDLASVRPTVFGNSAPPDLTQLFPKNPIPMGVTLRRVKVSSSDLAVLNAVDRVEFYLAGKFSRGSATRHEKEPLKSFEWPHRILMQQFQVQLEKADLKSVILHHHKALNAGNALIKNGVEDAKSMREIRQLTLGNDAGLRTFVAELAPCLRRILDESMASSRDQSVFLKTYLVGALLIFNAVDEPRRKIKGTAILQPIDAFLAIRNFMIGESVAAAILDGIFRTSSERNEFFEMACKQPIPSDAEAEEVKKGSPGLHASVVSLRNIHGFTKDLASREGQLNNLKRFSNQMEDATSLYPTVSPRSPLFFATSSFVICDFFGSGSNLIYAADIGSNCGILGLSSPELNGRLDFTEDHFQGLAYTNTCGMIVDDRGSPRLDQRAIFYDSPISAPDYESLLKCKHKAEAQIIQTLAVIPGFLDALESKIKKYRIPPESIIALRGTNIFLGLPRNWIPPEMPGIQYTKLETQENQELISHLHLEGRKAPTFHRLSVITALPERMSEEVVLKRLLRDFDGFNFSKLADWLSELGCFFVSSDQPVPLEKIGRSIDSRVLEFRKPRDWIDPVSNENAVQLVYRALYSLKFSGANLIPILLRRRTDRLLKPSRIFEEW